MALVFEIIDFIEKQNKLRPIVGDVLFIGKQETFGRELHLGPAAKVHTMDWSPHFGADFVCDLGKPVPDDLCDRFDFIYDGGSLDNMWSPSQGMVNMARMLRSGGRMVCLACSSAYSMPYTMFSPGWFYDYFETNKFVSYETYLCSYRSPGLLVGTWKWFPTSKCQNGNRPCSMSKTTEWLVVSLAEKGPNTTYDAQPIQYQYRPGVLLSAQHYMDEYASQVA